MATQRLTVATLAGQAALAVAVRFERWRATPEPAAVDRLCEALRADALALPVVYFAEWVDRWLMGDLVPGPGAVEGHRFQATALSSEQTVAWAERCGRQFPEQQWLASRLREAAAGWGAVAGQYTVVVVREAVGPSATDDELRSAWEAVPGWLLSRGPRRTRALHLTAAAQAASGFEGPVRRRQVNTVVRPPEAFLWSTTTSGN